jgi:hypothetical protein
MHRERQSRTVDTRDQCGSAIPRKRGEDETGSRPNSFQGRIDYRTLKTGPNPVRYAGEQILTVGIVNTPMRSSGTVLVVDGGGYCTADDQLTGRGFEVEAATELDPALNPKREYSCVVSATCPGGPSRGQ